MKKTLAFVLAAMMLLCSTLACAQEMPFEGSYIGFEDYGFQICLPNDWNVLDVSDVSDESGIFFAAQAPDSTWAVAIQYTDLGETYTIDQVAQEFQDAYGNASVTEINGISFVSFRLEDDNQMAVACLGGQQTGMYVFFFTPADDADFTPIAQAIAGSISAYEAE